MQIFTTCSGSKARAFAGALLCLLFGAGNLQAQQVADPSVNNPNYDSWKSQASQEQLARVAATQQQKPVSLPGAGSLKQAAPTGGTAAEIGEPACFIPLDASYITLARSDDASYGPIALGFDFDLYGTTYNQVWINNNGNLTFGNYFSGYTSIGFPITTPMVAPFWADVDTRNPASGTVHYKLNATNLIVTWDAVGYYSLSANKRNTFQVIIGTNADALTGLGQNVSFRYGDMQWSQGGATPPATGATVGVNHGNGTDYVQVGRFHEYSNYYYDGPGGNNDALNYLDGKCFSFDVSNAGNLPPSVNGLPNNNTVNLACGESVTLNPQFLAPEVNQSVTVSVNTGGLCNTSVNTVNGTTASATVTITATHCNQGTHQIVFTATDDGNPAETTTSTVTVNIGNCCNVQATASGTNVGCFGAANGGIDLTVANAAAPVTFAWSNGATTEDLSDLGPGTYTVDITDAYGCTATASATITQPDNITPTANPDLLTVQACQTLTFTAADLLGNDTDPQGSPLELADVLQPSSGVITQNANGSYTFTPAMGFSGNATFTYVAKKDDPLVAYSANGHFYEYVPASGICWSAAKAAAANRSYFGMQGYLATITTAGENAFAAAKLQGNGWIGGSDEVSEGAWRWATGPEAGMQFWQGNGSGSATAYQNWQGGEPNDYANEDYAHFYSGTGTWNDLTDCPGSGWISGYVVEYGGLESCLPQITATGTVTVQVTAPNPIVVNTQNTTVQLDAAGNAAITANQVNNGSLSDCGIASISVSPETFTCANVGPNTVTLTVTDNYGQTATGTAVVTVEDNIAPTAVAQDYTVQLDANGQALITAADINNGSSDACGIATVTVSPTTFGCSNTGANQVTLTVTDVNGNSSQAIATVTVEDNLVPTISCGSDVSVVAQPNDCNPVVTWAAPTGADNCTYSIASTHESGDRFSVGTTTVTYTITDASGNTASCSFTVTVTPTPLVVSLSSPTFTGGNNISCNGASDGSATAAVTGGCQSYSYAWSNGQTTATATNLAAGTYSVTVTDANGTTEMQSITLTEPAPLLISGSISPAVAHPGAQLNTIYLGYGPQSRTLSATASGGTAGYTYNWSPATDLNSTSGESVVASPTATTTYTVTATDVNGCSAETYFTIQVIDARCGNNPNNPKVIICHNGNEICISPNAVLAHLAHGCAVGPCGSARVMQSLPVKDLILEAYPNPSNGNFTLQMQAATDGLVVVELFDMNGRSISRLFSASVQSGRNQALNVNLSALPSGIYVIRMQNGTEAKSIRIAVQP